MMKRCTLCGENKPYTCETFATRSWCRPCKRAYDRAKTDQYRARRKAMWAKKMPPPDDGNTDASKGDHAFCAAMRAAGFKQADPVRSDDHSLPTRFIAHVPVHGSWMID